MLAGAPQPLSCLPVATGWGAITACTLVIAGGETRRYILAVAMAARALQVVYLLWAPLGEAVVRRFADSYRANPAGVPHQLVVVCNGFSGRDDSRLTAARRVLDGIEHTTISIDPPVLDIAAYRIAAERLAPARCCFLNSFSTILAPGWLAHLGGALDATDVGLVGASGSWGSMRSFVRFQFGLGGPYSRAFADRRTTTRILASIAQRNLSSQSPAGSLVPKLRTLQAIVTLQTVRSSVAQTRGFRTFPAPHVRSTGFMIDSETIAQLDLGSLGTKMETYRIESGAASITRQVQRLGMRTLVVDRDGRQFEPGEWPSSHTFWQGRQEKLMLADKQTEHYEVVDAAGRAVLSGFAWGELADPRRSDAEAASAPSGSAVR